MIEGRAMEPTEDLANPEITGNQLHPPNVVNVRIRELSNKIRRKARDSISPPIHCRDISAEIL